MLPFFTVGRLVNKVHVNVKGRTVKKVPNWHWSVTKSETKIVGWHCKLNNLTWSYAEWLPKWLQIESIKLKRSKEELQFISYFEMINRPGIFIGY